jgi:hypothetical protein
MAKEHDDLEKGLLDIVDHYEEKDRETHDQLARECAKYEYYWRGIQDLIWDPVGKEWVSASGVLREAKDSHFDPTVLEKVVNIYRSYGESVIAALANTTPPVRFFPDDAEDPADIATAKAYSSLSDKINRDNDGDFIFVRALYTIWNQHFVAAYNTHAWDEKFGTLSHDVIDTKEVPITRDVCPDCGYEYTEEGMEGEIGPEAVPPPVPGQEAGFGMGEEALPMEAGSEMGPGCPQCGSQNPPISTEDVELVPFVKESYTEPKGQEIIEVYGPRNVKLPPYATELEECPYLILETELSGAYLAELYPDYLKDLTEGSDEAAEIMRTEREGPYIFGNLEQARTLKRVWLRPWAFNMLPEDKRKPLKKKYPNGCIVFIVDDMVLEHYDEDMDDHWTLVADPLSHEVHGDPMGKPLIPIQDMVNDLESLSYETVLAGVPEFFFDTQVLNAEAYSQIEAKPNQGVPAQAPPGQNLGAGFFQPKSASLSRETVEFRSSQDQNAQFVTGAFPSIYGGMLKGDRTLGEYQQSRAQALQRLLLKWKFLNKWWAKVMFKACESYRRNMETDEKFVKQEGDSFENVWIRQSDMTGRIADVYPEASDQFPMTWEQTRGVIMELLQIQHPFVQQVFMDPRNMDEMSKIFSLSKFKVPGQEHRFKQKYELSKIKQGQPVMVDPILDDHNSHLQVLMDWAASAEGREAQEMNPQLYQAVLMHAQEHQMIIQEQMAMQAPPEEGGGGAPSGDTQTNTAGAAEAPPEPEEV